MNEMNPAATNSTAATTPPTTWYVERGGERTGPLSTTQVQQMIDSKLLTRESLSWQQGQPDWKTLASTEFASAFSHEPPPLTGAAVPNTIVWVLAFAPLIGEFLAGLFAGLFKLNMHSLWWITLALNIVLSLLDERKLKAAGHDTKRLGSAWLVPVYLYKRAQALKHNLAYFIVWVACFVLIVLI